MHGGARKGLFLDQFSDPDINFKGVPTGRENMNDVVKLIENKACDLAAVRSNPDKLEVSITGPTEGWPNTSYLLQSSVTGGGVGTYDYDWRVSTDGINYGQTISTTSYANITLPSTVGDVVTVRLTVTSSDNQIVDEFHFITVASRDQHSVAVNEIQQNFIIEYYPNPTSGYLNINLELAEKSKISIILYDSYGQLIDVFVKEHLNEGIYNFKENIEKLADGCYFLNITSNQEVCTKPLYLINNK